MVGKGEGASEGGSDRATLGPMNVGQAFGVPSRRTAVRHVGAGQRWAS